MYQLNRFAWLLVDQLVFDREQVHPDRSEPMLHPWSSVWAESYGVTLCSVSIMCIPLVCSGPRPEDPGRLAGRTGVLGQGQVVQHPGLGLEPAGASAAAGPGGPAAGAPGDHGGIL